MRLPPKLLPPDAARGLARPRLHARLDAASALGAVWLNAEGGAGKSTLAAAWAAGQPRPLLWYRLDATDLDAAALCRQLIARVRAGHARRAKAWPVPAVDAGSEAHARSFFRRFHAEAGPCVLVFDDAHAAEGPALATLLQAAVEEAPAGTTVLVTSRRPPFGALLDTLARGTLQLLDGRLLAFTEDEALALLAPRVGAAEAARLHRRTEGWAAGLVLLASQPEAEAPAAAALAAFFAQRVLGALADDDVQLLAAVHLLPDVGPAELAALGLAAGAAERLDALVEQVGFVQRLAPRRWRLHDLLQEALQAAWPRVNTAPWRARMLARAAALNARDGRLALAVRQAQEAGSDAAALLAAHAEAALARGHASQLRAAARQLDGDVAPRLHLQLGHAAWQQQDADALAHYEAAWQGFEATSALALEAAACALGAQYSGWNSFAGREQWLQRFLAAWPARATVVGAEAGLRIDKAALLCFCVQRMAEQPPAAVQALQQRTLQALADTRGVGDSHAAIAAAITLAEACHYTDDRLLLARTADAVQPWLRRPGAPAAACANWWVTFGWITVRLSLGQGAHPEGEAAVELGVRIALDAGAAGIAFHGLSNLVAAAASRGDLALARQRQQQLQDCTHPTQPTQQATAHLMAARLLTMEGDAATGWVRLQRALEIATATDMPAGELWIYHLGQVQVLTALGREDEAAALAERTAAGYTGLRESHLRVLGGLARLARAWRMGEPLPPGLLADVVQGAARHAWVAFGNHLPALAARVCGAALAAGLEPAFVRTAIVQRRLPPPDADSPHWPWPLRIHALGGLRVLTDGEPLDFGARPQRKPLDLLKLLVARGPAPVASAWLVDALWPEADGAQAKASFDMALLRLRKLLGRDDAVRLEAGRLGLNRGCVWVDAWAWQAGADVPYAGPLFGDPASDGPWLAAREALHAAHLRREQQRGQALEAAQQPAAALALYEQALRQDPLAEELHRGVIRCHLALGEAAAAQRAFQHCREALWRGLRVEPAPATRRLLGDA